MPHYITCMWNLKYNANELIYKTENRLRPREQICGCRGGGGREGMKWEFGVSRGTVSYMGWINSKVLLYSIGNYIQYPVINHNGK